MSKERGYSAEIIESVKFDGTDFSKRDIVKLKTAEGVKLDSLIKEHGEYEFKPIGYAISSVHNELVKNGNKDYKIFLILTENEIISTSSENFFDSFCDIATEMAGEDFTLRAVAKPSKNYSGTFYTCELV